VRLKAYNVSGAVHDARFYATGGEYRDTARKMTFWAVEAFNPATGTRSILPHMLIARVGFAAALLEDHLHAMGGGFQSDGTPGVEVTTTSRDVIDVGTQ